MQCSVGRSSKSWPGLSVQCSAVQCSALQCSAVQSSVAWMETSFSGGCLAFGNMMHSQALQWSVQYCSGIAAVQCSALGCIAAVQCSAVQCSAVQSSKSRPGLSVQCSAVQCSPLNPGPAYQCSAVQCSVGRSSSCSSMQSLESGVWSLESRPALYSHISICPSSSAAVEQCSKVCIGRRCRHPGMRPCGTDSAVIQWRPPDTGEGATTALQGGWMGRGQDHLRGGGSRRR